MLYLIKLDSAYKIGYSQNVETRILHLSKTHVEFELLSTKFGSLKDEKELHRLCEEFKIKNELFEVNDEVIKIFNQYVCKYLKEDIDIYNNNCKSLKEKLKECNAVLNRLQEIEQYIKGYDE